MQERKVLRRKLMPISGNVGLLGYQCIKSKKIHIPILSLKLGCDPGLRASTFLLPVLSDTLFHLYPTLTYCSLFPFMSSLQISQSQRFPPLCLGFLQPSMSYAAGRVPRASSVLALRREACHSRLYLVCLAARGKRGQGNVLVSKPLRIIAGC